jgi:hypothetical protein
VPPFEGSWLAQMPQPGQTAPTVAEKTCRSVDLEICWPKNLLIPTRDLVVLGEAVDLLGQHPEALFRFRAYLDIRENGPVDLIQDFGVPEVLSRHDGLYPL